MAKKPGDRQHYPNKETRGQVKALVAFGVTHRHIAEYLSISVPTLYNHYEKELETAKMEASMEVANYLFHAASGRALEDGASHSDCLRAAMFWLKTQEGWRDTSRVEHTGEDGGPVEVSDAKDRLKNRLAGKVIEGETTNAEEDQGNSLENLEGNDDGK